MKKLQPHAKTVSSLALCAILAAWFLCGCTGGKAPPSGGAASASGEAPRSTEQSSRAAGPAPAPAEESGAAPQAGESSLLTMAVQVYEGDNVIELPQFTPGAGAAAEELNAAILDFVGAADTQDAAALIPESWRGWTRINAYPLIDEHYAQVVVTKQDLPNYGSNGTLASFCCDIRTGEAVTLAEALALYEVDLEALRQNYQNGFLGPYSTETGFEPCGFLITPEGLRLFLYITTVYSGTGDAWKSIVSYRPAEGDFVRYDGSFVLMEPQELTPMDPPLRVQEWVKPDPPTGTWTAYDDELGGRAGAETATLVFGEGTCTLHIADSGETYTGPMRQYGAVLHLGFDGYPAETVLWPGQNGVPPSAANPLYIAVSRAPGQPNYVFLPPE